MKESLSIAIILIQNEKIVQAEEVGAEKVTVEGVSEEGILFRAFPENELYVKMRKESVI